MMVESFDGPMWTSLCLLDSFVCANKEEGNFGAEKWTEVALDWAKVALPRRGRLQRFPARWPLD